MQCCLWSRSVSATVTSLFMLGICLMNTNLLNAACIQEEQTLEEFKSYVEEGVISVVRENVGNLRVRSQFFL